MMRKNVKRAPPKAKGGMSSITVYGSRTSVRTARLTHSQVDRPSGELLTVALVLAALAGLGGAAVGAAGVPDRLDRFRELALARQARAQTGGELTADAYREMYALLDEEIVESLASGGPFASPGILPERLDAFRVVWSTAELFPQGLVARSYTVRPKEIRVRYELRYPGWTPGCDAQTEGEDVYRLATDTGVFARPTRTYHQPWHQELHAAVWRLLEALGVGDEATLAALVPDARLRRRLPPELRAEPACDAPEDGPTPRTVSVPASEGRTPWELVFRRTADGWRLTRATQVLP